MGTSKKALSQLKQGLDKVFKALTFWMRRLDFLIVKEIVGPWCFGVALFGSLLFAGTYLNKVTEYISKGVAADKVIQVSMLLLPAILVQTFAMSVLLAGLLGFGRISSDSELVAIRAAGVSLFRIIAPVSVFSILIACAAFGINETMVPAAAKQSVRLLDEIARDMDNTNYKDTSYPIVQDGKLKGMLVAKDFSPSEGLLRGVTIISYMGGPSPLDRAQMASVGGLAGAWDGTNLSLSKVGEGEPMAYLYASEMQFDPKKFSEGGGWRIRGTAQLTSADGTVVINLEEGAWPPEMPAPTFSIADLLNKELKSFELLSMRELRQIIDNNEKAKNIEGAEVLKPSVARNYEYGYWNKIALPLAAFIFGTLGAALGIRNHRTGTAAGFALAIAIIFAYFMLANFMNVWALNGAIPPYVASFSPIAIGLLASVIIIWRRNA